MTNYIEEMMKMARVKPVYIIEGNKKGAKLKATFPTKKDAEHYKNAFGGIIIKGYDFTAERQLEIIKLLGKFRSFEYLGATLNWGLDRYSSNLAQVLAKITTELMKASELDKQKVKEILEG